MPDTTTSVVLPPPETVVVSETVTVFPASPPPAPAPEPLPAPPPPPAPEPVVGEAELLELVDGMNALNTALEGGSELPAQVTLDPMQFGALGIALAVVLALLAFLAVVAMRR